ncbi:hypothetical protein KBD59_03745 [Candidatus Gracilibacteria bacterium]|nr:hypothetical protein [Candidatus Gracilibacteria bacterium]
MNYKKLLLAVHIASILGMLVTGYLIYQHYKPAGESFCNINEYISCDIVNKSEYSELFGVIPVSVLGFLSYLFFGVVSAFWLKKGGIPKRLQLLATVFGVFSLIFSLYLTYIEFFVLFAVCIFCLAQQVLILIISLILLYLWYKQKRALHS